MNIDEKIRKRFADLETQGLAIPVKRATSVGNSDTVDVEAFQRWASSAMHLLSSVFREESPHYRNFASAYKDFRGYAYDVPPLRGVFLAAKSDYDGGILFSLQSTISGEVFGDFVTAAKRALAEGHKDVAAVLACAALEDALKRFAQMQSLAVDDKDLSEIINALKGAGLLSGPQKSLVDAMPRIRNAAMHAEWTSITSQDVGSVIGYVEQFLLAKFT
jgi:hypothetical protein